MGNPQPVPDYLLRPLWFACGATSLFLAATTVQGIFRPGYDSWQQAISALSLGPEGWLQMINFIVLGVIVMSTMPTWRRVLAGGRAAVSYPALILAVGCGLAIAGLVPQDPAPGYDPAGLALTEPTLHGLFHLAIACVTAVCSVAGFFVMAARFAQDPQWSGWAWYSRGMAVMVIASIVIYGVWSTHASGFAGTFERLAVVIPLIWNLTLLNRLRDGVPFML